MKEKLTIVKVGGKIVEDPETLSVLLADFAKIEGRKILVHGGGRSATRMSERLGIPTKMVDGRRITDDDTLRVVTMVYGGLVNKTIVAMLQSEGINAVGLTGADMNIVRSDKRPVRAIDYGWVGDVRAVDGKAIATLVENGYCPVVAPLTHDGKGHLLNTNADTMAAAVAMEASKTYDVSLMFCFEKKGVLDAEGNVITSITPALYKQLKADGTIADGMIPKLDNAFECIASGVTSVFITESTQIVDPAAGTRICF